MERLGKEIIKTAGIDIDWIVKSEFGYTENYEYFYTEIKDWINENSFSWVDEDGELHLFVVEDDFSLFIENLKDEVK